MFESYVSYFFFFLGVILFNRLREGVSCSTEFFYRISSVMSFKFALVSTWRYDRGGDTILLSFLHFYLFFLFIFYLIFFYVLFFQWFFNKLKPNHVSNFVINYFRVMFPRFRGKREKKHDLRKMLLFSNFWIIWKLKTDFSIVLNKWSGTVIYTSEVTLRFY